MSKRKRAPLRGARNKAIAAAATAGPRLDPDGLYFLPLGGSGEIGMNLNLYAHQGQWLMLDCGITFDNEGRLDPRILMPDPSYIAARKDQLQALVITHAHEDHLGAVPDLWKQLQCPVYCTPFASALLLNKLNRAGLRGRVPVRVLAPGARFTVGVFDCEYVPITHSTPESCSVMIRTPAGNVLHTGDWKLDPDPVVGADTAEDRFREIGDEGVLAAVSDSTNATVPGWSRSEGEVKKALLRLFRDQPHRIIVTQFSSNIARTQTLIDAAEVTGRHPVLVGTSMYRYRKAALAAGLVPRDVVMVPPAEAGFLPRDKVLLICTGSQGEHRAALSRIAADNHPDLKLDPGDTVVFSSRLIPGNELPVKTLQKRLEALGARVITQDQLPEIHASGHPCREELATFYGWTRPQMVVPVHGTPRHMQAHAEWAEQIGVPRTISVMNGAVVRLAPEPAGVVGQVPVGRWEREIPL